jgi:Tetratricopeptide repeat
LGLKEVIGGKMHPSTPMSMKNLALVLRYQSKYKQAEEVHGQVLGLRETVLGKEYPETPRSMHCLTHLFHAQRRYQKAGVLYQIKLTSLRDVLGPDHPTTMACQKHYSLCLRKWKIFTWRGEDGVHQRC